MNSKILVSGKDFIRADFSAFVPVLEDMINSTENEIILATYVITDSAIHILKLLNDALSKGIKLKIIVNHINKEDVFFKKWVQKNRENYANFVFKINDRKEYRLHAKVIISDRKKAIVGSANYTWSGMIKNFEIGTYLEGSEIWKLASLIELTFFY